MYPAGDLFTDRAGISTLFYIITQTDRICKNGTQYLQGVNRNVTDTAFLQRPCERRNTLLEKCRIFDVKIHMPAYAKEYAFETVDRCIFCHSVHNVNKNSGKTGKTDVKCERKARIFPENGFLFRSGVSRQIVPKSAAAVGFSQKMQKNI